MAPKGSVILIILWTIIPQHAVNKCGEKVSGEKENVKDNSNDCHYQMEIGKEP